MNDEEKNSFLEELMRRKGVPPGMESAARPEAQQPDETPVQAEFAETRPALPSRGPFSPPGPAFWAAFVEASAKFPAQAAGSGRTDLGAILAEVRSALAELGLGLTQQASVVGKTVTVETALVSRTGEAYVSRFSADNLTLAAARAAALSSLLAVDVAPGVVAALAAEIENDGGIF